MSTDLELPTEQPRARVRVPLKLEEVVIAGAMATIALITGANVAARYLSNISLAFTEEFSVVLMVIVTVLGTSLAMASGRHVRISYFTDMLNARGRRVAEIVAMLLVIACFSILAVYGASLAWDEYRYESLTPGMGHPQWLHTGWLPLLSLAVIGRAIGRIVRLARGERG